MSSSVYVQYDVAFSVSIDDNEALNGESFQGNFSNTRREETASIFIDRILSKENNSIYAWWRVECVTMLSQLDFWAFNLLLKVLLLWGLHQFTQRFLLRILTFYRNIFQIINSVENHWKIELSTKLEDGFEADEYNWETWDFCSSTNFGRCYLRPGP